MENFLLRKYRRDRRKLIDFILSVGLIKEIRTPEGAVSARDVDWDIVSADYVLECAKNDGVLELPEATRKYYHERSLPIVITSQSGSTYFLLSEPEMSGPPPQHQPPKFPNNQFPSHPSCSSNHDPVTSEETASFGNEDATKYMAETATARQPTKDVNVVSLTLPILRTGLSDHDLQETAYEVLLASVALSGGQICSLEDKKERKSKFLVRRSKKGNSPCLSDSGHYELLDTVRIQMEVSETMDACTRQALMHIASRIVTSQADVPQVSLELLSGIWKSSFSSERSYMQWQKRQANILEELLFSSADQAPNGCLMLRKFLSQLRSVEEWTVRMAPSERAEVLTSLRNTSFKLSSVPAKFGVPCETYFWTRGYHLNIKLYEKLLCSVFDILEEGQIIEEADDILGILKLSWKVLGITQKLHNALFSWVLFQQFLGTGESMLLECAIDQIQKVVSSEGGDRNEEAYLNSLICSVEVNGNRKCLSLIHAVFLSISVWCDSQLQDYHLHFSKKSDNFRRVLNLTVIVGLHSANEDGEVKFNQTIAVAEMASKCLREYVKRSIQAEYKRVLSILDAKSKEEKRHPLAILANELKLVAEREYRMFSPELLPWCAEARTIPVILLHRFYGERLRPFLDGLSLLSEDVRSVLPAADMLERYLMEQFHSACDKDMYPTFCKDLQPYKVGEVSAPIILHWVNMQQENILEWTERAFDQEDWEPLSLQKRQAASVIEVFRIIEETVDQFFNLNLPMNVKHLQSLVFGIVQSLQAYLFKLTNRLGVDKNQLFPAAPALTRYKEAMNPFIKKKLVEHTLLEEDLQIQLNELTTSKLCVRLNTLHYIQGQIGSIEDAISKQWMLVRPLKEKQFLEASDEGQPSLSGSVDELFTCFNHVKKAADDVITKICDFFGTKVLFWDLRDSFLRSLYRGDVESSRLERSLSQLDIVLDHICALIADPLRDPVVLSICQASFECYVWILLDGGPSRAFSETDITMIEEDLEMLKDFFIANGEGLPHAVVEQQAKLAQQILTLYTFQTEDVITMLVNASEQISNGLDSRKPGRSPEDADTLLRVLCHKKDREASKFLKRHYQLPMSSEYEDSPGKDSTLMSPLMTDLLKRSASFRWSETGKQSLRSMKKKFQEATSEIKFATAR